MPPEGDVINFQQGRKPSRINIPFIVSIGEQGIFQLICFKKNAFNLLHRGICKFSNLQPRRYENGKRPPENELVK